MALEPGSRIGPYEVIAPLITGSEERYKATDTRRNRVVTVTMLPSVLANHPELKARLERDARTISSLNHPSICAHVDIGHEDPATDFVVADHVEGETLSQRLNGGPLEMQEALTLAIAMADALDMAHRRGVVHGGLNPSVVMLTAAGPKLLDFGLASVQGDGAPNGSMSLATTRTSLSALSAVPSLTAPYTAPETFAGGERDSRGDIFAFGAILYEMVAGRPAFHEKTLALLVAALQTVDPEPLSKAQPMAPPALDYLVRRCLHKDPRQRLQTALDLANELRWLAGATVPTGITARAAVGRQRREWPLWAALATVSVLAVGLVPSVLSSFAKAPEPGAVRFAAPGLPTGLSTPLALSPDGRWLVASPGGLGASGVIGLSLDSVTSQLLARQYNVTQPFWSPDSRSLAFFEESKLKRFDIGGGPAQIICDAPPPYSVGTWNGDGIILFPGAGLIQRVLAAGGQPAPITALDQSREEMEHVAPFFLPDGRHFLFLAVSAKPGESAIYVGSLDSTERTRLFAADSRTVYAPPGYLLFNRADTVFAQSFDADKLALSGEPIRVASAVNSLMPGLGTSPSHARWAAFTVSQTGVLAYRTGAGGATGPGELRSLVWLDRSGQRSAPLGPPGLYAGVDISPDGKRFVVHRHEGTGGDNWLFDVAEGRMQKLTFDGTQDNQSPIWSPDATRIAFASLRDGKWGLYVKAADGAAPEELITESDAQKAPSSWSPDGNVVVYQQGVFGATEIWAVPVAGDRKPFPVVQGKSVVGFPQVSSDGKWLAYASNETGRFDIYVKPFPKGDGKWQVSTDGGNFPRWRGDGKELYFTSSGGMFAADIRVNGSSLQPGVPHALFAVGQLAPTNQNLSQYYNRFAVTADGQRFLVSQPVAGVPGTGGGLANAIIDSVDGGGGTLATGPNNVSVVLNWPQLLKQK